MKNVYQQKRQQGFTIIEVLIVLAIAALIFLIVFLAVPALQRNARNNGIKNDAANLLASMSSFQSNNNGVSPGTIAGSGTGTITFSGSCPAGTTTQTNQVSIQPNTVVTLTCGVPGYPAGTGTVALGVNVKCNGNVNPPQANQRSLVALFRVETGSSTTATQCVES